MVWTAGAEGIMPWVVSIEVVSLLSLALAVTLFIILMRNREFLKTHCPELLVPLMLQSCGDAGWSIVNFIMYAPPLFGLQFPTAVESHAGCTALGFLGDVFQTVSVGYYTVIGVQALVIIKRYPFSVSQSVNRCSHFVIGTLSLFVAILPAAEGEYNVTGELKIECWVHGTQNPVRLLFYTPVVVSLLFAVTLLLYVFLSAASTKLGKSMGRVLNRLMAYVLVFAAVWLFPIIDRLWPLMHGGAHSPLWLSMLHSFSLSAMGAANFAVWSTSKPLRAAMAGEPHQSALTAHVSDVTVGLSTPNYHVSESGAEYRGISTAFSRGTSGRDLRSGPGLNPTERSPLVPRHAAAGPGVRMAAPIVDDEDEYDDYNSMPAVSGAFDDLRGLSAGSGGDIMDMPR